MKRALCILASLVSVLSILVGQQSWQFQNPQPQGNDLKAVSFYDRNNGWAVGAIGTILRTTDGGTSWQLQNAGTTGYLYAVAALSPTTCLVGGPAGLIFKTTNGGSSWTQISTNISYGYMSFCFVNSNVGYAVALLGGTVSKTTDGGNSWININTGFAQALYDVSFSDVSSGWIAGGSGFYGSPSFMARTTDGGANWTQQTVPTSYGFYGVCAMDSLGWAVGYDGVILRTTNGGKAWTTSVAGNVLTYDLNSVSFRRYKGYRGSPDSLVGVAVGANGTTFMSRDGGITWTQIMGDFEAKKTLRKVQMLDSLYWYAVGEKDKILRTTNAGSQWAHLDNDVKPEFWGVAFTDSSHGIAVGDSATQAGGWTDGKIYATSDGGKHWNRSASFPNTTFQGAHYPVSGTAYAAGYDGRNAIVAKTSNAGTTWTLQTLTNFQGRLWSVFFHNALSGVVVGDSGVVLTTSDGGNTWTRRSTGTTKNLFFVYFSYNLPSAPPSDTGYVGYAVGSSGTVLKSKDGGSSWGPVTSPTTSSLYGVTIIPRKAIWIVGSGKIYKSTVDGVFTAQTSPVSNTDAISAVDENRACIAGALGNLIQTTDGGKTWVQQIITSNTLRSVYFVSSSAGWIVGEAGAVLRITGSLVSDVREDRSSGVIPTSFTLNQNYPDPFNPSTTIRFGIPYQKKVQLKVFDLLGREVATLVDSRLEAGSYSVKWDASGYSSGVYFYVLQAEDVLVSKKMLLVK